MNSNGMTVSGRQTPPLGLVVFQFYGKVGTEKTKSQGGIFMHMADALVTPAVAGTMYAFSAAVVAYSIRKVRLLALGCNVWNMAFYGCFIGTLIWHAVNKKGFSRRRITAASVLGCILTLQLGAFN